MYLIDFVLWKSCLFFFYWMSITIQKKKIPQTHTLEKKQVGSHIRFFNQIIGQSIGFLFSLYNQIESCVFVCNGIGSSFVSSTTRKMDKKTPSWNNAINTLYLYFFFLLIIWFLLCQVIIIQKKNDAVIFGWYKFFFFFFDHPYCSCMLYDQIS